jgi:hypothetical protein
VTPFDLTVRYAHGKRGRVSLDGQWNVFLGSELIDHFEDRDDAIELARKVAARSRRPIWSSSDGVTFEPVT